jgi:hypothetical protein
MIAEALTPLTLPPNNRRRSQQHIRLTTARHRARFAASVARIERSEIRGRRCRLT